jgi:hypothetical protein
LDIAAIRVADEQGRMRAGSHKHQGKRLLMGLPSTRRIPSIGETG